MSGDPRIYSYRIHYKLLDLRRANSAATAAFQDGVPAWADYDAWRFLVYADIPRVGWVRTRLRELVQRRPEVFVIERDGKDRQ
jgi:hypothetical protein